MSISIVNQGSTNNIASTLQGLPDQLRRMIKTTDIFITGCCRVRIDPLVGGFASSYSRRCNQRYNSIQFSIFSDSDVCPKIDWVRLLDWHWNGHCGLYKHGRCDRVEADIVKRGAGGVIGQAVKRQSRVVGCRSNEMIELKGHRKTTDDIIYPNGRWAAAASLDRSIRLWDVRTGKMLARFLAGHRDWIRSLAFQPDGSQLVQEEMMVPYDCGIWRSRVYKNSGDTRVGSYSRI